MPSSSLHIATATGVSPSPGSKRGVAFFSGYPGGQRTRRTSSPSENGARRPASAASRNFLLRKRTSSVRSLRSHDSISTPRRPLLRFVAGAPQLPLGAICLLQRRELPLPKQRARTKDSHEIVFESKQLEFPKIESPRKSVPPSPYISISSSPILSS